MSFLREKREMRAGRNFTNSARCHPAFKKVIPFSAASYRGNAGKEGEKGERDPAHTAKQQWSQTGDS
uniref:Uncharacterized protein n=1 Tax=Romanomermis culicivorax TaxID=13658 RepID=A0A915JN76_ROMCU